MGRLLLAATVFVERGSSVCQECRIAAAVTSSLGLRSLEAQAHDSNREPALSRAHSLSLYEESSA
eukprot:CAMPEP_0185155152 /NCGR_PEP_ID=MMETSP1139-20130426/256_1 /TAXON_ID=298111 /ORGANISM="Pavlova sp., Strain CCMP459" /LENGTH=64 /DNA_ID=CAMNT_0027720039 /DNA_START=174 /DNA_END=368 /DNA_ORIENTATION=+